ncbi:hypothetical protein L2221_21225, partial [Xanthomonas perforans]|nr:hypothetical protein [Xanthomonas perforans]
AHPIVHHTQRAVRWRYGRQKRRAAFDGGCACLESLAAPPCACASQRLANRICAEHCADAHRQCNDQALALLCIA